MAQARHRLSLLDEISIYTTGEEESVPLRQVMDNIQERFGNELPVNAKSSTAELEHFMEQILPDYDSSRVYASDMKKLVQWYQIVSKYPNEPAQAETAEASAKEEKGESAEA